MNYGKTIKNIREENNVDINNLAKELGVTGKYIEKLETNRVKPALEIIEKVCELYNIEIPEFFIISNESENSLCKRNSNLIEEQKRKIDEFSDKLEHMKAKMDMTGLDVLQEKIQKELNYNIEMVHNTDYSNIPKEFHMYRKGCCVAYLDILSKIEDMNK